MANSSIEWTEQTWNPIAGCNDVSEGCRNCYARTMAGRLEAMGSEKYRGLTILQGSHRVWTGKISFDEKALMAPLKRKKPTTYFVNSMSDLFHHNVTDEQIDRIFAVMALCPRHSFQVLTKRPERMLAYLTSRAKSISFWESAACAIGYTFKFDGLDRKKYSVCPFPLPNVRLGVSVENQKAADARLDHLCELASLGWHTMVSFEPLLGAVDPGPWWLSLGARTWAIVGGESGHGARPMNPDWARGLRDRCVAASVPFFFKQWGEWTPGENVERITGAVDTATWFDNRWSFDKENLANNEGHIDDEPDLYRVGKKAAGALLDGREWREMPNA